MRNAKLVLVIFAMLAAVLPKAEANVFSDNFEGGVADWTITTQGLGSFDTSTAKSVSPPCSFYMDSMGTSRAQAVSPLYDIDLNLTENYHVSFYFLIPDTNNHWFEVFNNHQTYLVIDNDNDLKSYDGDISYLIDQLLTDTWHHIVMKVYPDSENYDVYVDEEFKTTCSFWVHSGFENTFQIGDRENTSTDHGKAYWDDFVITQPVDSDGDGIMDPNDNCPYIVNPDQADRNSDGWGDRCECIAANSGSDSGHVDLGDFALFSLSWRQTDPAAPSDINSDGIVDSNDLEIVAYHWLSDCCHQQWAIIVGISDYNNITDLSYADDDANDWYNYFNGLGYEHITVLGDSTSSYAQYDDLATEENIHSELEYITQNAGTDDIIAFVFSGHGGDDGIGNSYLAAWDSGDGVGGYDGDFYDQELRDLLSITDARVFVFLDSCKCGGMMDDLETIPNASKVYTTSGCTEDGFRNELPAFSNGAWTYWFLEAGLTGEYNSVPATTMEECFDWADLQYNPGGVNEPAEFDGDLTVPFILW